MDAKKGAKKHNNYASILSRWQNDEKYGISQSADGQTEDYCRHLDVLKTIDISYVAPYHQMYRYENTITMQRFKSSIGDTDENKNRIPSYHKCLGEPS